ncbi:MAG: hypothetical protein ACHQ2E_11790 [Gemmatimonadales bacterium]
MDPLEFGLLLTRKRGELEALASSLTGDAERAGVAVRCTICEAWWARSRIPSEADLDPHLIAVLRDRIRSDLRECGQRTSVCPRPRHYSSIGVEAPPGA